MVDLATVAQLASMLKKTIPDEDASAVLALNGAQRAVRDSCGWDITTTNGTTTLTTLEACPVFSMVALPAKRITSATVTADDVLLAPDEDYLLDMDAGIVDLRYPAKKVVVEWEAGYAEPPDSVTEVVLDLAAARFDNPRRLRSWQVGQESETYTGPAGHPVTADTDSRLDPYRLGPVIA